MKVQESPFVPRVAPAPAKKTSTKTCKASKLKSIGKPVTERFIRFEVTDSVSAGGQSIAAIGELDVLIESK